MVVCIMYEFAQYEYAINIWTVLASEYFLQVSTQVQTWCNTIRSFITKPAENIEHLA